MIKTSEKIKDPKTGKSISFEDEISTIGGVIYGVLGRSNVRKYKCYSLAKRFADEKEVALDASDIELINQILEADQHYPALLTGPVTDVLNEEREGMTKKKKK